MSNACVLGMPRLCEHEKYGSGLMRVQVISLRPAVKHDVAGSEAEQSASSNESSYSF